MAIDTLDPYMAESLLNTFPQLGAASIVSGVPHEAIPHTSAVSSANRRELMMSRYYGGQAPRGRGMMGQNDQQGQADALASNPFFRHLAENHPHIAGGLMGALMGFGGALGGDMTAGMNAGAALHGVAGREQQRQMMIDKEQLQEEDIAAQAKQRDRMAVLEEERAKREAGGKWGAHPWLPGYELNDVSGQARRIEGLPPEAYEFKTKPEPKQSDRQARVDDIVAADKRNVSPEIKRRDAWDQASGDDIKAARAASGADKPNWVPIEMGKNPDGTPRYSMYDAHAPGRPKIVPIEGMSGLKGSQEKDAAADARELNTRLRNSKQQDEARHYLYHQGETPDTITPAMIDKVITDRYKAEKNAQEAQQGSISPMVGHQQRPGTPQPNQPQQAQPAQNDKAEGLNNMVNWVITGQTPPEMESKDYQGGTYERPKGSNSPWQLKQGK